MTRLRMPNRRAVLSTMAALAGPSVSGFALAQQSISSAAGHAAISSLLPNKHLGKTELNPFTLETRTTALVLIDLQQGIIGFAKAPYSAAEVLHNAAQLAERVRAGGGVVVRVRVGFSADGGDMLRSPTDTPAPMPPGGLPSNWLSDPAELPIQPGDLPILKHHWNAFNGTELDLQLRRRGIKTVVLGGLVTPFGVESTARTGWELGYEMVFAEDLSSAPAAELHLHSMRHVLPRLGRVRCTAEVLAALS
jgi:nicotinamidase-related amidase